MIVSFIGSRPQHLHFTGANAGVVEILQENLAILLLHWRSAAAAAGDLAGEVGHFAAAPFCTFLSLLDITGSCQQAAR